MIESNSRSFERSTSIPVAVYGDNSINNGNQAFNKSNFKGYVEVEGNDNYNGISNIKKKSNSNQNWGKISWI